VRQLDIVNDVVGFGGGTTGGKGGSLCQGTTLADSGPGSLRDCATRAGAQWITFASSGTINLTSQVVMTSDKTILNLVLFLIQLDRLLFRKRRYHQSEFQEIHGNFWVWLFGSLRSILKLSYFSHSITVLHLCHPEDENSGLISYDFNINGSAERFPGVIMPFEPADSEYQFFLLL
jgi:hypothetical protein